MVIAQEQINREKPEAKIGGPELPQLEDGGAEKQLILVALAETTVNIPLHEEG